MTTDTRPSRRKFLRLDAATRVAAADSSGIHIAGVVVHTRPESLERVRAGLAKLSGAEIHAADPKGKLVVTLEAASDGIIADLLNTIPEIHGVIACTLAHHHSEAGEEQNS